jgi:hypothetical protein
MDELPSAEPKHIKLPSVPDSWAKAAYSGAYEMLEKLSDHRVPENCLQILVCEGTTADTFDDTVWCAAACAILVAFQREDEGLPEYDPDRRTWFIRFKDGDTLLPQAAKSSTQTLAGSTFR